MTYKTWTNILENYFAPQHFSLPRSSRYQQVSHVLEDYIAIVVWPHFFIATKTIRTAQLSSVSFYFYIYPVHGQAKVFWKFNWT